jgi:subtilisin family serine protease
MTRFGRRLWGFALVTLVLLALVGTAPVLGFFDAATSPTPHANRYIIELDDPPLAQYEGTIGKHAPTAAYLLGDAHLRIDTPAARAYLAFLDGQQQLAQARIRAIAPAVRFDWQYRYVFNGFAAKLTPEQARLVLRLPEVRGITVEEKLEPEMDASLPLMNAEAAFDAVGGIEEAGLGARVAIMDSGVDSAHSMFADEGMLPAPDEFPTATMHLRDGSVTAYPDAESYINNKLVAARIFVSPEAVASLDDPTHAITTFLPIGTGHGMHVAGIAAGRHGTYNAYQNGATLPLELSGVAPMAHVFNYKANYAASPEYIAMLEQMVVDEIDALNISQGHVVWLIDRPETHALSQAFGGAFDAGVVVVASAGNAGSNGLTSLSAAFKYSEKVMAVGNTTANGSWDVKFTLTGEGRPADELIAAPRSIFTFTEPVEGGLIFVDDGCTEMPEAAGKIAVSIRYQDGGWYGPCTYGARAENMAASGAKAIVYYYDNRYLGGPSTSAFKIPAVALGTHGGADLIEWLKTDPPDAAGVIDYNVLRGFSDVADLLSSSSSRGPGLDWQLKPDISAPGTGIMSAVYAYVDGAITPSVGGMSGTSMASPQVAGAATLVRSAHPDWTSAEVRGTLINTSKRSVMIGPSEDDRREAAPYEAGPGRLDLEHAIDPGAFITPPKASFGDLAAGETADLVFEVTSASAEEEQFQLIVEPITGTAPSVDMRSLVLAPGETKSFTLTLDTRAAVEQLEIWGDVLLHREGSAQMLRLAYYAFVDVPEQHKDVMLIDWTWGDTPDYSSYYTETLTELGLTYGVWRIDDEPASVTNTRRHPPLAQMKLYDLVIVNQNESDWALQTPLVGQYQYLNYLLSGGDMLLAGQGEMNWWRFLSHSNYPSGYQDYCGDYWPKCFQGPSQNGGCDMCLPRYFSGFTYEITATLSGRVLNHPERPLTPTVEVVIEPHEDTDGPFTYGLDISTGDEAKDGAAGNQYTFASGSILGPYVSSGETAPEGRDYDSTEGVFDRVQPYARPVWSYTGDFENAEGETEVMTKTVGTYIAGKLEPGAQIAWNSMFLGFGLEGVGEGADGTASRARFLGDTFNFLARNIRPDEIEPSFDRTRGLLVSLADYAEVPVVDQAVVDWGDGSEPETIAIEPPVRADEMGLPHDYVEESTYQVKMSLRPTDHAAPIYDIEGEIEGGPMITLIYMPIGLQAGVIGSQRGDESLSVPRR